MKVMPRVYTTDSDCAQTSFAAGRRIGEFVIPVVDHRPDSRMFRPDQLRGELYNQNLPSVPQYPTDCRPLLELALVEAYAWLEARRDSSAIRNPHTRHAYVHAAGGFQQAQRWSPSFAASDDPALGACTWGSKVAV
jgi:hypothetical protein